MSLFRAPWWSADYRPTFKHRVIQLLTRSLGSRSMADPPTFWEYLVLRLSRWLS